MHECKNEGLEIQSCGAFLRLAFPRLAFLRSAFLHSCIPAFVHF
jgi:hypothetical protein